jgi:predicted nucleic acid-binding protein
VAVVVQHRYFRELGGVELGLSAYDGTHAALAESYDAVLVTADRRLAAAVRSAELVE